MAYSSSASQWRPCVEREHQPKPHQATVCRRHQMTSQGSISNPLLSQEFYRAASNLGTAIMEPQQVPPQQCPVGNHHALILRIESAIANMQRHEQALSMPSTGQQQQPTVRVQPQPPPYYTPHTMFVSSRRFSSPSGIQKTEDQRLKAQDHCSLAT